MRGAHTLPVINRDYCTPACQKFNCLTPDRFHDTDHACSQGQSCGHHQPYHRPGPLGPRLLHLDGSDRLGRCPRPRRSNHHGGNNGAAGALHPLLVASRQGNQQLRCV